MLELVHQRHREIGRAAGQIETDDSHRLLRCRAVRRVGVGRGEGNQRLQSLGQFTRDNLTASLVLLPLAIASSLAGVWLVRRVPAERFYTIVYWLMVAAGGKLLFDGVRTLV